MEAYDGAKAEVYPIDGCVVCDGSHMTDLDVRRLLAASYWAEGLTASELGSLARVSRVRRYRTNDVLWLAGTASQGLHVIVEGRVRVVRGRDGRQHLVHTSEAGDTMGEVPLFGSGLYPATAIAAEDTTCLVIPPPELRALVANNGDVGARLLQSTCTRIEGLVRRLDQQTFGGVRARLAASILGLPGADAEESIPLPRPRSEWAEDLGTVREVLARELSTLVDEGLIERAGSHHVHIRRPVQLRSIAFGSGSRRERACRNQKPG